MAPPIFSAIELLEARIAPALTVLHPIPDLVPGVGQTGATLDLANVFDAAGGFRTHIRFDTNYIDPANPGVPQVIELELFDDKAPLTVANFLRYVNGLAPSDYDGVFFHRTIPGFVLQGGGFALDAPATHIALDPQVHNEFDATDPERSNVAGTIAMAKTALGPHTADSEWFVNLANNSHLINPGTGRDDGLDVNNGGYTVFGKITTGMDVVNAIAALTDYNFASTLNGALTDVPLQNYDPDPDSNPATPPPVPTAAQFITITHASVIAPTPASAAGVSFSVIGVTAQPSQLPTDLVSGTIVGQSLQLDYKPGASGVAKVIVKASKAGDADVFEDFLVTLKPNIVAIATGDSFEGVLVPGDLGGLPVQVANSGAVALNGNFDVTFYLSKYTEADPLGTFVEPGVDVVLTTLLNQSLSLASGATASFSPQLMIPQTLSLDQEVRYRIIAGIQPSAGTSISELFTDDNVALEGAEHVFYNAFGSFGAGSYGSRANVPLTYVDAGNHLVTVTLTGGGFGQFDPALDGSLGTVVVSQTTEQSALSITTADGVQTVLKLIYIDAPIGTATLGDVTLSENFQAHGGVKTLTLGGFTGGAPTHTLTIDAYAPDAAQRATITLGEGQGAKVISAMPVALLDITGTTPLVSFEHAYRDAANQLVTLTVVGGGYGEVDPQHNGSTGRLEVRGTNASSVFSLVMAAGAQTQLDSIDIAGSLGNASLGNVTLKGDFAAHGGLKTLTLGNVGDGTATHTISILPFGVGSPQKATITLGVVRDFVLTSAMPIGALTAVDWLDSNASSEAITAPGIDSVLIKGDTTHRGAFQADLIVTGTTKLQSFIVTGTVSTAKIQVAGDVGLMRLGALVRSQVFVGVTSIPRTLADFGVNKHRIETFKILNSGAAGIALNDSQIVAARILNISVSKVAPASGVGRFGFIADRITTYQVGAVKAKNLTVPQVFDRRTHYMVKIV